MSYNAGGFVAEDMNEARDRMKETSAAQWTIPTVMPNGTALVRGNMEKQLDVRFSQTLSGIYKVGKPGSL